MAVSFEQYQFLPRLVSCFYAKLCDCALCDCTLPLPYLSQLRYMSTTQDEEKIDFCALEETVRTCQHLVPAHTNPKRAGGVSGMFRAPHFT